MTQERCPDASLHARSCRNPCNSIETEAAHSCLNQVNRRVIPRSDGLTGNGEMATDPNLQNQDGSIRRKPIDFAAVCVASSSFSRSEIERGQPDSEDVSFYCNYAVRI
jgi:hypothetical protein